LRELIKIKRLDWEQRHSEEDRLNKELARLRNPSFFDSLDKLITIYKKKENPIDK
jgi:hypothetical protein